MKGTLHKINRGWIVKQIIKEGPQVKLVNQYPLVDNGHIDGLALYKSNEGLEVEFEILTDYDNNGPDHFPKFARIIIPKLMILTPEEDELKDWDVTLMDGLEDEPYISDDFQIGSEGAYEHANPDIYQTKPGFVEKRMSQMLEQASYDELQGVIDLYGVEGTLKMFKEAKPKLLIDRIANEEFKNVGDEGLFPNHTDKDIWTAGFKAGYLKK